MSFRALPNPYPGVSARVYDPPKEKPPANYLPPKENIPKSAQFAAVEARFMHIKDKEAAKKVREVPPSPFHNPVEHQKLAQRIVGRVSAKYFDPTIYHVDEQKSPRKLVEAKVEKDERIHSWRSDIFSAKNATFDDLQKQTTRRMASLPPRKKSAGHSAVKEYIRNGSPIRHPTMSHITEQGNTAAEQRRQRANTPTSKPWHSGGVVETNFVNLEKKSEVRKGFKLEQKTVAEKAEKRLQKKVNHEHVPRVALLAPSVVAAQSMSRASSVHSSSGLRTYASSVAPSTGAVGSSSARQSHKPVVRGDAAAKNSVSPGRKLNEETTNSDLPSYDIQDGHGDEGQVGAAVASGDAGPSPAPQKINGTIRFRKADA